MAVDDGIVPISTIATAALTGNLCPQCGNNDSYVFEEGCKKCYHL